MPRVFNPSKVSKQQQKDFYQNYCMNINNKTQFIKFQFL